MAARILRLKVEVPTPSFRKARSPPAAENPAKPFVTGYRISPTAGGLVRYDDCFRLRTFFGIQHTTSLRISVFTPLKVYTLYFFYIHQKILHGFTMVQGGILAKKGCVSLVLQNVSRYLISWRLAQLRGMIHKNKCIFYLYTYAVAEYMYMKF